MKNQCDGCRAGKPLYKHVKGLGYVLNLNGDTHIMGEPGKYADVMACTRHLYICQHEYERDPHCHNARVCNKCGEHAGLLACGVCGWKEPA